MNKFKLTKEKIALTLILILSAILNLTNLNIQGYSNEYYAAGVKSMMRSFKNFFFVSFDPMGFVSIDKPPVGFWMQAISAKIFGFNSWSIILPQAIAGVVSVGILYYLVKKYFGIVAGLISAFCLAVTPIFVATSRNNTVESQLAMVLLIAGYFLFKALESGKLKHLIISLAFVGIGFNIKMLEAYLICPAIYLTYFIASKIEFKKRIINLIICSFILVVVSLSWAAIVDLVPASERPYVGSSSTNSEIQLIVGHNGVERVSSSNQMAGAFKHLQSMFHTKMGLKFGGGEPGITRLISAKNSELPDQISWLLPLALFGFLAAALKEKLKRPFDNEKKLAIVFWISFLVLQCIYFSITTGTFQLYYLTILASPVAALVGIGMKYMMEFYNESTWKSYLLPVAFIIDGVLELMILLSYLDTSSITKLLITAVIILSFGSAIILIINKIINKAQADVGNGLHLRTALTSIGLIGLLIAPTVWSGSTLFYQMLGNAPSAGLQLKKNAESGMMDVIMSISGGGSTENLPELISYLKANKTNEKYLLVTSRTSGYATSIILNSNESAMALGGYMGSDEILTLDEFKQKVKDGEVRYVMEDSQNSEIMNWVKENGKLVDKSEWSGSSDDGNQGIQELNTKRSFCLYDLKGCVTD